MFRQQLRNFALNFGFYRGRRPRKSGTGRAGWRSWRRQESVMRIPIYFLMTIALVSSACTRRVSFPDGSSWDPKSAVFGWWAGEVRLPAGFTYLAGGGLDTFEGRFTSPDGRLVVRHDIGGYAGAYASRAGATVFKEWVVDGARVWIAHKDRRVAVTFPDSGCANFFIDCATPGDAEPIDFIARSFRPKDRVRSERGSCR